MGQSRERGKSGERVRRDTIHDKPPNHLNQPKLKLDQFSVQAAQFLSRLSY